MTTKRMQKKTQKRNSPVPVPVESVIHTVRGQKVILDTDLARIYDVGETWGQSTRKKSSKKFIFF